MAVNSYKWIISAVLILLMANIVYAQEFEQKSPTNSKFSIKTDKDEYKCDERVIIKIKANPNATYTVVVQKPDGSTIPLTVTTDAIGNGAASLMTTPPSGTWLVMLYDNNVIVAEWKFKVDCKEIPNIPKPTPCFTIVSDSQTLVDRGNTVNANVYPGWPTIPGATYIWSNKGLDTNNAYTFTKHFWLNPGYDYSGTITINADDQWLDLKINNVFIANEPVPGWGNIHSFAVTLQPGYNTLEVKAVDIGAAYAGLAFKLDVYCKPMKSSVHWDKIIFSISQGSNATIDTKLKPLLGKTLDIKVVDNPRDVAILEDKVRSFLAAKYNLTQQAVNNINVRIINVEYAIDSNIHNPIIPMDKVSEEKSKKREEKINNYENGIYYTLPLLGAATILSLWYRKIKK